MNQSIFTSHYSESAVLIETNKITAKSHLLTVTTFKAFEFNVSKISTCVVRIYLGQNIRRFPRALINVYSKVSLIFQKGFSLGWPPISCLFIK